MYSSINLMFLCWYIHSLNPVDISVNRWHIFPIPIPIVYVCQPLLFTTHHLSLTAYSHGPLARYVMLQVAHAPGIPGTFSLPPRFGDPVMHHSTCVTHLPWWMPGSLTSGFLWSRWKRSRHSRLTRTPQFYVSDMRPMVAKVFAT